MNRTLKRPMFRMGGSTGTGITSGLDQPRKQYREGTPNPYDTGVMSPGTLPGFLTGFGLDLISRPPEGNIFQTAASAAKDPFEKFQMAQMRKGEQMGERNFLRSERESGQQFKSDLQEKALESNERIAGMSQSDDDVMAFAEIFRDVDTNAPNLIKGANAVNFFKKGGYDELVTVYGKESVSTKPIDVSVYVKQSNIKKFRNSNPGSENKVYFDVSSGTAVKLVQDVETGNLKFIKADSSEIDQEGEMMPDKNTSEEFGLFNRKVDEKKVEEFKEEMKTDAFDIGNIYDE